MLPVDYIPMKREDLEPIGEVLAPPSLADDLRQEEDLEYDEDETENYEKNAFLREKIRQYLLNKELDSIRNQIEDEDDYDPNYQWLVSKLQSPAFANIYSGFE